MEVCASGCNVYISEGLRSTLVQQLKVCADKCISGSALVHTFVDKPYNRTGFTLVSPAPHELAGSVVRLARAALETIDLRSHAASHPRLGVVDHISCHPLGRDAALTAAAETARSIGTQLGEGELAVPVFLYGSAGSQQRSLADLRRACGYFKGSKQGAFKGASEISMPAGMRPDFGPSELDPRRGLATVGALPWVVNFNILLQTDDLQLARQIARAVSGRGGGLPSVEAMALPHEEGEILGIEIACNLLDVAVSPTEAVAASVQEHADRHGITVGRGYMTGKTPEELCSLAEQALADRTSN
ncbi:Formiminotransferase [Coccomyxa subellipsoidea C-169]|uniref:glutamate formimidoyltransferase n=1 Tax=Coccomyxa subellipsoidea (strain C-169) TaxID=574566 RepID=I0YZZ2_COCSC|nr:Formiminotransferase [Coccomyxa subellipsoidea C-169]EIE23961.1 Formiminotransferase [Coccomyxa subellipsoidea C-169]|eukprot:XP_005648505.1 Formiminotransferase [Coccomyxa subellipsoidea C-169]